MMDVTLTDKGITGIVITGTIWFFLMVFPLFVRRKLPSMTQQ